MSNSDVSRSSNMVLTAYLRTTQSVQGHDDMGNDILMGRIDIQPVLDQHVRPSYLSHFPS